MTTDELYNELNYVNHSREKRKYYANLVINNPELIPNVVTIALSVDDKQSPRAAWLLEFVTRENLPAILPVLDKLLPNMKHVHKDSAVRPMAKICEYLIDAYYKQKHEVREALTNDHKDYIIENCFDWMISNQKIAPKAYSMNVLYLLGNDYDWIHPELAMILERDYQMQSSGFKARARQILKKIKQKT